MEYEERDESQDRENWDDHRSYMTVKRRKLQDQFQRLGEKHSSIFSGVTIYVNGYTDPEADRLKHMIHANGGRYSYMPSSRVTHVIATNLPHSKIRNLTDSSLVCTPAWVVDSIAAGKQLHVGKYRLYASTGQGQRELKFKTVDKKGQESPKEVSNLEGEEQEVDSMALDALEWQSESPPKIAELKPSSAATGSRMFDATKSAEFVSEFYTHSRLHHLSTWSTELKQFTKKSLPYAKQKIPRLSCSESLKARGMKVVVHIDVDCFFVSVSIREKPYLKGKPVAVTHASSQAGSNTSEPPPIEGFPSGSNGGSSSWPVEVSTSPNLKSSTSDIASCSYEAREFGIRNGMSVGEAIQRCPELILVPYMFQKYRKVSQILYETLMCYSHTVQAVSCDEAYIELSEYVRSFEEALGVVGQLRAEIEEKTGCTASAGVAHSVLLARMATRKAKPNGQYFLPLEEAAEYLASQPLRDLPGVGWSLSKRLQGMGIGTCGELRKIPLSKLKADFGAKTGESLYYFCRGMDQRELKLTSERKSLSVDINFGIRFTDMSEAESFISQLALELQRRAEEAQVTGEVITLKMKVRKPTAPVKSWKFLGHGVCDSVSRSCHLLSSTQCATEISRIATRLLRQLGPDAGDIRGMGIQLTRLTSLQEGSLRSSATDIRNLFPRDPCSSSSLCTSSTTTPSSKPTTLSCLQSSEATNLVTELAGRNVAGYSGELSGLDLPSPSQLDVSVLLALPADIQESILSSYSKMKPKETGSQPMCSKNQCHSFASASTKSSNWPPVQFTFNTLSHQRAFVEDLRHNLKQWVRANPRGPSDHDATIFNQFIESFALHCLHETEVVLKCFRRTVVSGRFLDWSSTFNLTLKLVQNVLCSQSLAPLCIKRIIGDDE